MTAQARGSLLKTFVGFLGVGSGGAAIVIVMEMLRRDPAAVIATLGQWGPMFVLCLGFLYVGSRGTERVVSGLQQTAAAQQSMADAINRIAAKDDVAARERELLLNDVAFTLKQIKDKVDTIEDRQAAAIAVQRAARAEDLRPD